MSSHITTDLEKIADYITFIHRGDVIFSKKKMIYVIIMALYDVVMKISKILINQKSLLIVKTLISGMFS